MQSPKDILNNVFNELTLKGNIGVINDSVVELINIVTIGILQGDIDDIVEHDLILRISNILYNNTDRTQLPLEDGIYDLLLENYVHKYGDFQVGAIPVKFSLTGGADESIDTVIHPFHVIENREDMLYFDRLIPKTKMKYREEPIVPFTVPKVTAQGYLTKRLLNTSHEYPELVGTLNKSKFVMSYQAEERGVVNDSNVRILERDFFQKHIESGILDPRRVFKMILELKYDGVSLEGEVSNRILSARTRGDANEDIAADLTPIFGEYPFTNALNFIPDDNIFGMKFEAIITKDNLLKFNQLKQKDYKNCRTAVIGLISSSDAYEYRNLITLVPLASSLDLDRHLEVEFLNKFYANDEPLRYTVIEGNYQQNLFQIKRFVEEAEVMRSALPFMYDGVVVSYIDEDLKQVLGRKNAINLYSEAIKFNALKKQTIFRGYSFTVGQDGSITPMIHYDPVEFYGTIHPNSTGHSYDRFRQLDLKYGDIIDVEYVNDVMPYVTKPDNSHNANNTNLTIEFPKECPVCSHSVRVSDTGKSAYCDNIECDGRISARMVNMMKKLNMKDFGEANIEKISKYTLRHLLDISMDELKLAFPGEKMADKLMERINELKTNQIEDYQLVGSLGFTNMAKSNWKAILSTMTISELINTGTEDLYRRLTSLKGIGSSKATVILEELPYFIDDLLYITSMNNVIPHKYNNTSKIIRFTGCRDVSLVVQLTNLGHDIGEGSVTKETNILIIPHAGYTSSKVDKAMKLGILCLPLSEFKDNLEKYL